MIEPWWRNIGSERSCDRQFNLIRKECVSLKNEWSLTVKRGAGRLSRQKENDLCKREHDEYPGQKERQRGRKPEGGLCEMGWGGMLR